MIMACTRQPVPAPPDSMRTRYSFVSAAQWQAYRRGYESDIQRHRKGELLASVIAPVVLAPIFAIAAAISHSAH